MSEFYDRQGNPVTMAVWGSARETDKRVAETTLENGLWVSTVWIGIDHRFGDDGPPLIFETMVFNRAEGWGELDCERYSTEAEAVAGHAAMCEKWAHEQVQS